MNRRQAIRIATEAINKEIHALAVDANLCDVYGATTPVAVRASKRRKLLRHAVELLQEIQVEWYQPLLGWTIEDKDVKSS